MAAEYASLLRSARSCIGEELVPEPERVKKEDLGTGSPHDFVAIMRRTRPPMDKMEHCALAYLLARIIHQPLGASPRFRENRTLARTG